MHELGVRWRFLILPDLPVVIDIPPNTTKDSRENRPLTEMGEVVLRPRSGRRRGFNSWPHHAFRDEADPLALTMRRDCLREGVTPSGRKIVMLQYRTNAGVRRKPSIGKSGDLTVE